MSINGLNPIKIFPDGDMWCALWGENLQEGDAAFAESPIEALTALLEQGLPYAACKETEHES